MRAFFPRYGLLLLLALMLTGSRGIGQSSLGQTFSSLFFLEGKNVLEYNEIELGFDELLSFEAFELQPFSDLELKVTGMGFKTFHEIYMTNTRGEFKTILFFPKAKSRLSCSVKFTTKNGKVEQIKFYLRPLQ